MKKILTLTSALVLAASPAMASAQAINPGDGQVSCLLTPNVFTNITPTKCVGFFGGNSNTSGTGSLITSGTDYYQALQLMGYDMNQQHNVVWKGESWGGGNLGATMYGITIVGFHWGNYPNAYEAGTGIGNVSAFYMFDAGTTGINSIQLNSTQGISNAVILKTGTPDFNTTVTPEPSSVLLIAAGLGGVGLVARRRRRA